MRKLGYLFVALISVTLSGCFTMMSPEGRDNQLAMQGKPAATIKIHREGSIYGSGRTTPIYINGKFVGRLAAGSTLDYRVSPGAVKVETSKFTLSLAQKYNKSLQFSVVAGKIYTVEVTVPGQVDLLGPLTDGAFNLELKS